VLLAIVATGREWFGDRIPVWPVQAAETIERIDPNTASAASLQRLRGIGEAKARAIVDYRATHGGRCFARPEDLLPVHGIGERLVAVNRGSLRFDAGLTER
jgi:competence protein ComEA